MEKQAGVRVLWSQWCLAFLPLALPTVLASRLTVRWLYPPETIAQSPDCPSSLQRYQEAHGLPITGALDAAMHQALDVYAPGPR
jgi:di/tricarboxylate transporter